MNLGDTKLGLLTLLTGGVSDDDDIKVLGLSLRAGKRSAMGMPFFSLKESAISIRTFEYLGMGKPLAIAGTGQARDVTLASVGGLVVERGDWRGLTGAAVSLLRANPARRANLGENARAQIQANATRERVAQSIADEVAARLSLTER